jgi:serine/threonine-protein kinase RsbW
VVSRFNWRSLWRRLVRALKATLKAMVSAVGAPWGMGRSRDRGLASQDRSEPLGDGVGMAAAAAAGQFPEFQQGCLRSPSRLEELPAVQAWFSDCVSGLTGEQMASLQLAIAEAFTNAVRHAHRDLDERTPIELHVVQRREQVDLQIWDRGQPYDLLGQLATTLEKFAGGDPLEKESGRGLLFIHRMVDSMDYQRVGDRNCLLLSKSLMPSTPPASAASRSRPS